MAHRIPRLSFAGLGALALLLLLCASASAHVIHNNAWAREKFAAAEHLRDALNSRPENDRTRHDYQQVIDAYRRVYLGCPTCTKADPSAVATAELLLEMGRQLDDDNLLRSAIKQYQFLRREYPGSKARVEALFTVGEIYKDDLDEPDQARTMFRDFLRRYPHSERAKDATDALTELDQQAHRQAEKKISEPEDSPDRAPQPADQHAENSTTEPKSAKYTRVTGILHWATSDSARVSIDLEQSVQFNSERLQHPSRIYFDLHDTRLAEGLLGKTFEVQNGPLKKIRVAQFERGRSRVVLEVDPKSEYKAFLLPNPNRLVIEIKGPKSSEFRSEEQGGANRGANLAESRKSALSTKRAEASSDDSITVWRASSSSKTSDTVTESPIPKRIVEADDDDASEESRPDLAESKRKPAGSAAARNQPRTIASAAAQPVRKRRSADGNDDEVATLGAPETKAEASALSAPTPAPAVKTASQSKRKRKSSKQDIADTDMREAQPTMAGDRSLIRALGLKIGKIVIDPGHGGHDTGTIGPSGVEEKDVVLDVAKRLGKLLQTRMGADVVYTRQDDTFIPLETRTAIANQQQADLFVSIHANSSRDEDARGVETYYLNFTSNAAALEVAARENAASDKSIHELQDLVKKIALKEKIEESREFATDVQRSLHSGLAARNPGIRDRGVKKAPFVVLIGANMPSILAEISFVSNPTDERKLNTPEYRQRIAESLYRGISKYVSGLSGVKVASRMAKSDAQ